MNMTEKRRITISVDEAVRRLREAGMRIAPKRLIAEIEAGGIWPFGRIVSTGPNGRRTVEILRRQFEDWLREMEN